MTINKVNQNEIPHKEEEVVTNQEEEKILDQHKDNEDRFSFKREEIKELLTRWNVYEYLTAKEILNFLLWSAFNRRKANVFFNALRDGKAAPFAYQDALKHK